MNSKQLDQTATDILIGNDKGTYTVPTEGLYPYQWNWDSAFAALGFGQFDLARAWCELHTLLSGQWSNGMVPHILFHTVDDQYFPGPDVWGGTGPLPSSGITQPPVAATVARALYQKDTSLAQEHISTLYEKLYAWHRWFMQWRVDNGVVFVTHPWESGRDNAPDWDSAMQMIDPQGVGEYRRRDTSHVDSSMRPTKENYDRYIWLVQRGNRLAWNEQALQQQNPFRVADPGMTFILLRATRDLAWLGQELGHDTDDIHQWVQTLEAGGHSLWNESIGCFDARNLRTEQWSQSISNASFLCWYAGIDKPGMIERLDDILSGVRYGVPSCDPQSEHFDAKRYWRGPVWGIMNMMIGWGLDELGFPQGDALRTSTAELIAQHGFAEYADPTDGSPAGGKSFTWTAAVWLAWASPSTWSD